MAYQLVSITICYAYTKYIQIPQIAPNIGHEDNSSKDDIISRESIEDKEDEEEDKEVEGQGGI